MPEELVTVEPSPVILKTTQVENEQIVMPKDTVTLTIEDIVYYKNNENDYDKTKKSPFLIYLSNEFKVTVLNRKNENTKKVVAILCGFVIGFFVVFGIIKVLKNS